MNEYSMMKPLLHVLIILLFVFPVNLKAQSLIPVTSKDPEAIALFRKAFHAADESETKEAEKLYLQALEKDTGFALAYMQLALLQGEFSKRTAYMTRAMQHINSVSEGERLWILGRNAFYGNGKREDEFGYFEKLVALHPEDAIAQYLYGYMNHHHGRKNYAKAIEHLEKSVQLKPTYLTALDDLAFAYMEIQDFANAERVLLRLISLQPRKVNPRDAYGEMLLRSGRFHESIEAYRKALDIDPGYAWSIFGVATNLNFIDRHAEARAFLAPLLTTPLPERESYHLMHAYQCSYLDEGKVDSAILILKQHGAAAKQKNRFTQRFLALSNATRILFEHGDTIRGKEAYQELNAFVQNETQNEGLKKQTAALKLYYDAYALYIGGHTAEARRALEAYVAAKGNADDQSKILLTKLHLREKDVAGAEAFLKQCDAGNPYVQFWLAKTYLLSKRSNEARTLLKKVAELNQMHELDYQLVRRPAIELLRGLR
ncbi:MAG TPA: tetratricopeptide repeat protein [Chitinophagaceae bacterium]|nr:tetratricopeptide repeat protein [Chitinophagaceae bacterium]